jgi:hypothetical protein
MPTQTGADLRPLYDTVLAPRLAALEHQRQTLRHAIFASALLVGLPVVTAFCGPGDLVALALPQTSRLYVFPVSILLAIVGTTIAVKRYALPGLAAFFNYRARFKKEIVSEIFRAVSPGATYEPFRHITHQTFVQSGLFALQGDVRGDDLVRGRIGETPFEASEMKRSYSTGGRNSQTVSVFHGLFFHLDFNKRITGRTVVQPRDAAAIRLASRRDLTEVTLEDPDFGSRFEVFSTNPVEARYILTPLLMERIVSIHDRTHRPLFLSFVDNRAFVAVDYGRPLFEPSIAQTTSFDALAEMGEHFGLAELVVEQLDLNTRIWTKDVDARLLDEKPAVDPMASMSTGDLAPDDVLKRITGEMYVDANTGVMPQRPARSRADVERYSDVAIVRYHLAWWALVCMVISLGFAAVAAAAVAMLVNPVWTLAELWPLLGVPEEGAEVFRAGAVLALGGCVVGGGFFALYWITYVRHVAIDRSEIRVKRGLSPFARHYPRFEEERILQMDCYLYLGRANSPRLMNPSLSPMLRNTEEARWVAWEMRRALSEIGRVPGFPGS